MPGTAQFQREVQNLFAQGELARVSSVELLARVNQERDQQAFATLAARHGPEVHRWCLFFLRNQADADELFQDVFLALWLKAGKVREPDKLDGWLFRIVRNKALNKLSGRKAITGLEGVEPAAHQQPAAADRLIRKEDLEIVMRELGRLRPGYQEALLLTKVQGLTLQATAERMGRPVGTISTFINRGLDELARRLKRYHIELSLPALTVAFGGESAAVPTSLLQRTLAFVLGSANIPFSFLGLGRWPVVGMAASTALLVGTAAAVWWPATAELPERPLPPMVASRPVSVTEWNRRFLVESAIPRIKNELRKLVGKDGTVEFVGFAEPGVRTYSLEFKVRHGPGEKTSPRLRFLFREATGGIDVETDEWDTGNWHSDYRRMYGPKPHPLFLESLDQVALHSRVEAIDSCLRVLQELKWNPIRPVHPAVISRFATDLRWRQIARLAGYWLHDQHPTGPLLIYVDEDCLVHVVLETGLPEPHEVLNLEGGEWHLEVVQNWHLYGKFNLSEDGMTLVVGNERQHWRRLTAAEIAKRSE